MLYAPHTTIVLATHNKGKVAEFSALLKPFALTVLSLDSFPEISEVEETGTTFAENALLKATTISEATGLVALADDSGLSIDALGGAPGVYSARYSATPTTAATDAKNITKVLENMFEIAPAQRGAHFSCVMVAATPTQNHITAEGKWYGTIANTSAGENGFGYDPIFIDTQSGKTAAQLSATEKNNLSHRAQAVQKLLEQWQIFWNNWLQTLQ